MQVGEEEHVVRRSGTVGSSSRIEQRERQMAAVGRVDIFQLLHPDGIGTAHLRGFRQCLSGPGRQAATGDDATYLEDSKKVGRPASLHPECSHARIPDRFFLVRGLMARYHVTALRRRSNSSMPV